MPYRIVLEEGVCDGAEVMGLGCGTLAIFALAMFASADQVYDYGLESEGLRCFWSNTSWIPSRLEVERHCIAIEDWC